MENFRKNYAYKVSLWMPVTSIIVMAIFFGVMAAISSRIYDIDYLVTTGPLADLYILMTSVFRIVVIVGVLVVAPLTLLFRYISMDPLKKWRDIVLLALSVAVLFLKSFIAQCLLLVSPSYLVTVEVPHYPGTPFLPVPTLEDTSLVREYLASQITGTICIALVVAAVGLSIFFLLKKKKLTENND